MCNMQTSRSRDDIETSSRDKETETARPDLNN